MSVTANHTAEDLTGRNVLVQGTDGMRLWYTVKSVQMVKGDDGRFRVAALFVQYSPYVNHQTRVTPDQVHAID